MSAQILLNDDGTKKTENNNGKNASDPKNPTSYQDVK